MFLGDNYKLKILPDSIWDLKHLEVLDLNQIELEYIPKKIENLKSLKHLYLNYLAPEKCPLSIEKLKNLEVFQFNYLDEKCPKDVLEMVEVLKNRGVQVTTTDDLRIF